MCKSLIILLALVTFGSALKETSLTQKEGNQTALTFLGSLKDKFGSFMSKLQDNASNFAGKLGDTKDKAEDFLDANPGIQGKLSSLFNKAELEAAMRSDVENMNSADFALWDKIKGVFGGKPAETQNSSSSAPGAEGEKKAQTEEEKIDFKALIAKAKGLASKFMAEESAAVDTASFEEIMAGKDMSKKLERCQKLLERAAEEEAAAGEGEGGEEGGDEVQTAVAAQTEEYKIGQKRIERCQKMIEENAAAAGGEEGAGEEGGEGAGEEASA